MILFSIVLSENYQSDVSAMICKRFDYVKGSIDVYVEDIQTISELLNITPLFGISVENA